MEQQHEDEDVDAVSIGLHRSFALETEKLKAVVSAIVEAKGDADPSVFKKAQVIVEKYQEQGQLREPLLEGIITPVMGLVRATVIEANGNKLKKSELQVVKKLSTLIHTLMNVCKYKTVVKFFPHQAADLELAVGLLEQCEEEVIVGSILKEESTGEWETTCCLLGDGAWHGGCLALAELTLLLPERLPAVCPMILKALHYDVRRGPHSVGSHVRDAAAYVCWAFVRAFSPTIMNPHFEVLAPALLTTACYGRVVFSLL